MPTKTGAGACTRPHWYLIEVIGHPLRYAGPDPDAAVDALASMDERNGDEGYAVAEHQRGGAAYYCHQESQRIECAALAEAHGPFASV